MTEVTEGKTHRNPEGTPAKKELAPWQERVHQEKKDLDEKIARLKAFLEPVTLQGVSPTDVERLKRQLLIMENYSAILAERIQHFA